MTSVKRLLDHAVRGTLILVAVSMLGLLALRLLVTPWPEQLAVVAHAGGGIDGHYYTNTIAAFDLSYSRGFRMIEVDFQTTSDGHHVCGHDWDLFPEGPPLLAEFLEWRQTLVYPPCMLEELTDWFARHPQALLVTDAKDSVATINALLAQLLPGQVVVQAYSREQLCAFADAGMPRVILTLYRSPVRRGDLPSYLGEPCPGGARAEAITMSGLRVLRGEALAVKLSTGQPVYAHTINGCVLAWMMLLLGADSLYTDNISPDRCMLPGQGRS